MAAPGYKAGMVYLTPDAQFIKEITKEFNKVVNKNFIKIRPIIQKKTQEIIEMELRASPTYIQAIHGDLRGHLGLENPELAMENIVKEIKKRISVSINYVISGKKENKVFTIFLLQGNYQNILNLPTSSYISVTKRPEKYSRIDKYYKRRRYEEGTEHEIDWLSWLLFEGDRKIIFDYSAVIGNFHKVKESRSGKGLMYQSRAGWKVPPEHQGTDDDNFIIRAFNEAAPKIQAMIESEIGKLSNAATV